jgi:hypothetical protein
MNRNRSTLLLASPLATAPFELLRDMIEVLGSILPLIETFRSKGLSPQATYDFETELNTLLQRLGRQIVSWTYNNLESNDPKHLPRYIIYENEYYRQRGQSPRRWSVWTLFGPIRLVRFGYRHCCDIEPTLFPLEINLGIEPGGATPALALRASWLIADNTQQQTLDILRSDNHVSWSIDTLRKVTAGVSVQMAECRHEVQVAKMIELLTQADQSRGNRKIVLSVGRDGIFVPIRKSRAYQEAATATLAIFDRRGKRLGTIYLGRMPEAYQTTLSEQLTKLITDVLGQWDGPMPRLCYVTDAGHHPTEYFNKTLRPMRHPRTGKSLGWEWVVDYFHACGYISRLAEAIFGEGKEAFAWARKMRRWLKDKPSGAYRVLHSAAALKKKRKLHGSAKDYAEAYNYLLRRLRFLDYVDYRRRGLPIGSGITEAGCKIVFTQRFKQSGMGWSIAGGQKVLDLRLLRMSQVWNPARDAWLDAKTRIIQYPPTQYEKPNLTFKNAA